MKKRIFAVVTLVLIICCAIGLAACNTNDDNGTVEATGVTLDRNEVTLAVGEDITLFASVTPFEATRIDVEWSSSNTSVATVDCGAWLR